MGWGGGVEGQNTRETHRSNRAGLLQRALLHQQRSLQQRAAGCRRAAATWRYSMVQRSRRHCWITVRLFPQQHCAAGGRGGAAARR